MLSIAAIIRRERHDPPMTDEERQRAMDFIVAQQAKNSVEIERLIELHDIAVHRFATIRAGRRARREMRERDRQLREQDDRLDRRLAEIAEFQAHTDRRLDALIDIVRANNNGRSS